MRGARGRAGVGGTPEQPASGLNGGEMQQAMAGQGNGHGSLQLRVTSWHETHPEGPIHCARTQWDPPAFLCCFSQSLGVLCTGKVSILAPPSPPFLVFFGEIILSEKTRLTHLTRDLVTTSYNVHLLAAR